MRLAEEHVAGPPVRNFADAELVLGIERVRLPPAPVVRVDRRFGPRRLAGLIFWDGRWRLPERQAG